MKSTYRILEYDGPIHSLRRWSQELQCYHFVAYHRPAKMMADVDALNRGPYHRMTTTYYTMITTIRAYDMKHNAEAYNPTIYNTMLSNGKTNLRKLRNWMSTPTHSLHAALLLVEVTNMIQSDSVGVSTKLESLLCRLQATNVEPSDNSVHTLRGTCLSQTSNLLSMDGVVTCTKHLSPFDSVIDPINDSNTTSKVISNNTSNTIDIIQSIRNSLTTGSNSCNDNISLPTGILRSSSHTSSLRDINASVSIDPLHADRHQLGLGLG